MVSKPTLSIVIASKNSCTTVGPALDAFLRQAADRPVELIVVDASINGTLASLETAFPQVKCVAVEPGMLVPDLWKRGLELANAPWIGFTIAECIPREGWINAALASNNQRAAAVGGPLSGPGKAASLRAWALYLSRYSRWMPPGPPDGSEIDDVAGDNAVYSRMALSACQSELAHGFWENLVNARLLQNGERLIWSRGLETQYVAAPPLRTVIVTRFQHGRHYSSTRHVGSYGKRLLYLLGAPLLVLLLLARINRRIRNNSRDELAYFWRSLPHLVLIITSWSLGEASGYLWPDTALRAPVFSGVGPA